MHPLLELRLSRIVVLAATLVIAPAAHAAGKTVEEKTEAPECSMGSVPKARPRPPGRFAFESWKAPAAAVIHLAEHEASISGSPPETAKGIVARWGEEDLRTWGKEAVRVGARIRSPIFDPPVPAGGQLRLRLEAGGATRIRITPLAPKRDNVDSLKQQRQQRTLEAAMPPAQGVAEVRVSLTEIMHGNWTDARGKARGMERLEITVPGVAPAAVKLEEITVESREAYFRRAAAGASYVERNGLVRPSWYVNGGTRVRFELHVPAGQSELRWHDAGTKGDAVRIVRVRAGDEAKEIARIDTGDGWQLRSASLAAWAGKTVVLELAVEGDGVGFFGDPRIVPRADETKTPDVIVYLIDTLWAEQLGAWGGMEPSPSPALDRLAREGVTFSRAQSSSSWTKPAIPTLMSGLWPTTHRVGEVTNSDRLSETIPVVQEAFRRAGWRAGSFAANPAGTTLSGLERGFDAAYPPRYWQGRTKLYWHPAADQLHEAFLSWLDEEADRPYFAYFHTLEVHEYGRSARAERRKKDLRTYHAAIRDADAKLAGLLAEIEKRKRSRDVLVVVVSDHGESFGDHGLHGHGQGVFQAQMHIPLIFWAGTALPPMTVDAPVGLPDVAPTLLDLVGLPQLSADGSSLAPYMRGGRAPRDYVAAALMRYGRKPNQPRHFALMDQNLTKIIRIEGNGDRVYDLRRDPCELQALESPALTRKLDEWLRSQEAAASSAKAADTSAAAELDAADLERLRALGYEP